jgi:hypothetical protein
VCSRSWSRSSPGLRSALPTIAIGKATIAISSVTIGVLLPNPRIRRGGRIIGGCALKLFTRSTSALPAERVGIVRRVSSPLMRTEQAMKQTLITTLALGLDFLSLLMAPSAAHAQRYLVNGHPATAGEEQILVSYARFSRPPGSRGGICSRP